MGVKSNELLGYRLILGSYIGLKGLLGYSVILFKLAGWNQSGHCGIG